MNEVSESEDLVTEEGQSSGPGARLRHVREQRELSVEEVATRLHLDVRTVEALEADRHEALPAPVFVRGYLRQYARLLEIDPEPLLASYRPPPAPEPSRHATGRRRRAMRLPVFRIPWRGILLLLLLAALVWAGFRFGPHWLEVWQARMEPVPEEEGAPGEAPLPLPPPSP